jgi:hypothetical protein
MHAEAAIEANSEAAIYAGIMYTASTMTKATRNVHDCIWYIHQPPVYTWRGCYDYRLEEIQVALLIIAANQRR